LGFFNDQRAALNQVTAEFFDGLLGTVVGCRFNKGETARAASFALAGHSDTADLNTLAGEGLLQFQLGDVVGEVAYEKARSH
jgi:hypothetical protein